MDRWNDELYHHGVLGMRWGHRKQKPISVNMKSSKKTVNANRQDYNKQRARLGTTMGIIGGSFGAGIGAAAGGKKGALIGAGIGAATSLPFFTKKVNDIRLNLWDQDYSEAKKVYDSTKNLKITEIKDSWSGQMKDAAVASNIGNIVMVTNTRDKARRAANNISEYGISGYKDLGVHPMLEKTRHKKQLKTWTINGKGLYD